MLLLPLLLALDIFIYLSFFIFAFVPECISYTSISLVYINYVIFYKDCKWDGFHKLVSVSSWSFFSLYIIIFMIIFNCLNVLNDEMNLSINESINHLIKTTQYDFLTNGRLILTVQANNWCFKTRELKKTCMQYVS